MRFQVCHRFLPDAVCSHFVESWSGTSEELNGSGRLLSFIKRRAAGVTRGWDDEVTDVPLTSMITEVVVRVRQKDPVRGKWCV